MGENKDIILEIELSHLAEIEGSLAEEIARKNELATVQSLQLAKIESLLDEEKKRKTKWSYYQEICNCCEAERFPCAIGLIESLSRYLPHDLEVRRWQASTYQRWGRKLIEENQLEKARIYLKKALKIDPHNSSLWSEVERDFRRLETIITNFAA